MLNYEAPFPADMPPPRKIDTSEYELMGDLGGVAWLKHRPCAECSDYFVTLDKALAWVYDHECIVLPEPITEPTAP